MEKIYAEIQKVGNVLSENLLIPNYQRPYRWSEENVILLLNDITQSWKEGKSSYRIGSVIINSDQDKQYIVDGQQRITTILLILKCLESNIGETLRNTLHYNHLDSKNAIINNKNFINKWLHENIGNEKMGFEKYILDFCEFVVIKVQDLSEAFQMFDSQNGRGKELEAYNLLKAYHIRAMETNSFEDKIDCDKTWEGAARYQSDKEDRGNYNTTDLLKQVINEHLYRSRLWSRKEPAFAFDKKQIKEFKGITVNKNHAISFPYQNKELLQFVVQDYFKSLGVSVTGVKSRFTKSAPQNINMFSQLYQNIINGKNFFEYTVTYVEIYKILFLDEFEEMKDLKNFIRKHCKYKGSERDGDRYLFELFKSLIMLVFDKFGEEGVNKYNKTIYLLVYRLRLEKEQVRYASVADYPVGRKFFNIIESAKSYSDLLPLEKMARENVVCKKDVVPVMEFFISEKISLSTADTEKVDLSKYFGK